MENTVHLYMHSALVHALYIETDICLLLLSYPKFYSNYLNISGMLSFCYSDHPQEFVDVVPRIANNAPKDDEDIIHIQLSHDVIRCSFIGRHGFSNLSKAKTRHFHYLKLQIAEGVEVEYQCLEYQRLNPNSSKTINIHKKDRYPCS